MLSCFRGRCGKSPSPKRTPPNLPSNMIARIGQLAEPRTRRSMSRATSRVLQSSRGGPIGLASGRVGRSIVSVNRPPVVNRSRATSKTPRIRKGSTNPVDTIAPQAYKNNQWKYYSKVAHQVVLFLDSKKGEPFVFNKHGRRVMVTPEFLARHEIVPQWRNFTLRNRRPNFHTWSAYQKRLETSRRLKKSTLNGAMQNINARVNRYIAGNRHALDDVPLSRLIFWANITNWMRGNGAPYVRNPGSPWRRYGSNVRLTKNMVLENINLMASLRN